MDVTEDQDGGVPQDDNLGPNLYEDYTVAEMYVDDTQAYLTINPGEVE